MNKKLILAAALALGAAGLSNAATVYITGSTAMRSTVFAALSAGGVGSTNVFASAPAYTVYDGGSTGNNAGNGGNYMTFSGTASAAAGGGALVVKCHWSGSEAGIHDVASGLSETFITDAGSDGADHGTNQPPTTTQPVDLAMADNNQDASQFSPIRGFPRVTTNAEVAVITFTFVRNPGVWLGGNVSSSQFIQAEGFFCPRAVFSGNAADTNDFVYISGRDTGSGTRVNTFGDTGYGIFNPANQIEINTADGTILPGFGEQGFSSGGTLAKTMGTSTVGKNDAVAGTTGQGYSVIAYLSRGDADTAIGLGAVELTYNGIAQSRTNVIEGTHSLWGNEYIMQHAGAATTAQNVYKVLATNGGIDAFVGTGTKAIRLSDMHCTRNSPISAPSHN